MEFSLLFSEMLVYPIATWKKQSLEFILSPLWLCFSWKMAIRMLTINMANCIRTEVVILKSIILRLMPRIVISPVVSWNQESKLLYWILLFRVNKQSNPCAFSNYLLGYAFLGIILTLEWSWCAWMLGCWYFIMQNFSMKKGIKLYLNSTGIQL